MKSPFPIQTLRLKLTEEKWENIPFLRENLTMRDQNLLWQSVKFKSLQEYLAYTVNSQTNGLFLAAKTFSNIEVGVVQVTDKNVSYFVRNSLRGFGYGTEMVAAACSEQVADWIGTTEFSAIILRENTPSINLITKSGFRFMGLINYGMPVNTALNFTIRFD